METINIKKNKIKNTVVFTDNNENKALLFGEIVELIRQAKKSLMIQGCASSWLAAYNQIRPRMRAFRSGSISVVSHILPYSNNIYASERRQTESDSMAIHADFGFRILDMCKVPLCLR